MKPYKIFGIVQPGLEHIAEQELKRLGVKNYTLLNGGIEFVGHQSLLIKCNLISRVFSRFIIRNGEFIATTFQELEAKIMQLNWQDFFKDQNLCLHVNSIDSKLYHEKAIGLTVISALNKLYKKDINVDSVPQSENSQLVIINVYRNKFTVSMDSSGEHLHKRGYMDWREKAPIRETIAAAMLQSVKEPVHFLLDPLCGSGTIPIEMAIQQMQLPLSRFRKFAFQDWPSIQTNRFIKINSELEDNTITKPDIFIKGSDIDQKSITTASHNADKAGVGDLIQWEIKDINDYNNQLENKLIVTNPPYGVRINGTESLKSLSLLSKQNRVYLIHPRKFKNSEELFSIKNGSIRVSFQKLT